MDPDEGAFSTPYHFQRPRPTPFHFLRPLQINSVCCIFKTNSTTFMARKTTPVGGFLAASWRALALYGLKVSDTLGIDLLP